MTRDWRYLGGLQVGVSGERDPDGVWVTGPGMTLELPVFDQRQAAIASLEARARQADDRMRGLAIQIRSDVRRHRAQLVLARAMVEHYRNVLIPLREQTVAYTQQEFNYMLVGALELIEAKKSEYDGYEGYVNAVHKYWSGYAALKQAVGGRLPGEEQAAAPAKTETAEPRPEDTPTTGHDHGAMRHGEP